MTGLSRATFRLSTVGVALALTLTVGTAVSHADTPSPSPSQPPTATAAPTPSPSTAMPTGTPTGTPTATPTPEARQPQAAEAPGLTLSVGSTFRGGFWSDIGAYAFRGSAAGLADGSLVEVYYRVGSGAWRGLTRTRTDEGVFAVEQPVGGPGTFRFAATTGGAPGSGDAVSSNTVTVTVGNAGVALNRPPAETNALKDPRLSGSVVPARSGVTVNIDVVRRGRFVKVAEARTDSRGRYALTFRYGHARLAAYRIRASYRVPNRAGSEVSPSRTVTRVPVLDAKITATTAAEVASTYRAGCPVGRSRLKTVTMNHYGPDKLMHRGVVIVRSDLTGEVTYAFGRSLRARFPITRMRNPNAYGGNDPRQMRADNTSGFNCRKVVGNPYRQSPHSYGIAIDVNPRQNPYRDVSGKWWPENGTAYIDRTPRRGGMMSTRSTLVRALESRGFFWGGRWRPGRDYQHFQY